jgi:hypothetical protein
MWEKISVINMPFNEEKIVNNSKDIPLFLTNPDYRCFSCKLNRSPEKDWSDLFNKLHSNIDIGIYSQRTFIYNDKLVIILKKDDFLYGKDFAIKRLYKFFNYAKNGINTTNDRYIKILKNQKKVNSNNFTEPFNDSNFLKDLNRFKKG